MIEYEFYIKSELLTMGVDTKLVTTKQATLGWSFYLLGISLTLIGFNILLSYRLKMFNSHGKDRTDQMEPSQADCDMNDVECQMVPKETPAPNKHDSKKIKRMISLVQ